MTESIIQIQHLSKSFGGGPEEVHALTDISLDIRPGEIFGIIGLSGAGKSTLVRCMNLLERPTSGTVLVDGKDMTALPERELRLQRRKITMIFQSFNLLMQRTCLKNVCFPMEIAGAPKARARKRAEELLELVLGDFQLEILEKHPVEYRCYCTRERVSRALISLGKEELDSLIEEQKGAELTCQFCDKVYRFGPEELRALRDGASAK